MDPLVEIAIEPRSVPGREALEAALQVLAAADPSLVIRIDRESGQTILSGGSEDQLDQALAALRGACDFNAGAPQVAYRETLTQKALIDHIYRRPQGPKGDFARLILQFEPLDPGAGYTFVSTIAAGSPLSDYLPGIQGALDSAREKGLVAGFPVIDFSAILVACTVHDVDSSMMALEHAARAAFRELRTKGAPVLLEPIMWVEVLIPDDHMGDVIGDLNSRRGQIQGAETRGTSRLVTAMVPLASMFGYRSQLQMITRGAGRYEMRYDHYERMPRFSEPPDDTFPPAVGMRA